MELLQPWRAKLNRDVDIPAPVRADGGRFVRQCIGGIGVKPQVDDHFEARLQRLNQLRFAGLARCCQGGAQLYVALDRR